MSDALVHGVWNRHRNEMMCAGAVSGIGNLSGPSLSGSIPGIGDELPGLGTVDSAAAETLARAMAVPGLGPGPEPPLPRPPMMPAGAPGWRPQPPPRGGARAPGGRMPLHARPQWQVLTQEGYYGTAGIGFWLAHCSSFFIVCWTSLQ